MPNISIFVVDDHEILRDGIRALLIGTNIQVIADFSNPIELLERLPKQEPDVILMDISMPKMTGLEALDKLKEAHPCIPVLMLSADTDENKIKEAVQKGALGFLPKDCSQDELIKGIRTVVKNQNYFGSSILSTIFKGYIDSTQSKSTGDLLSEREIEIIKLLSEGMSYKQIAKELFISPRTVESHKKSIFTKLDIENNAQLIKYAIREGITSLD